MRYITASFQSYDWGSKDFIQNLLNIPKSRILAEAWYGAHPKAPSTVDAVSLDKLLQEDPTYWLGPKHKALPYLMKILAAEKALSIQVHPDKDQAQAGYAREISRNIPPDDPHRNYRDPNHKPELILALTKFSALCGFRDYEEIRDIILHYDLDAFFASFKAFANAPTSKTFLDFFQETISRRELPGLSDHLVSLSPQDPYSKELLWVHRLMDQYPADRSVISPLLLNLIELNPSEAIFLDSGIIHAYLCGAGIEIMAASDNVLRAGLTHKYIDSPELIKILKPAAYHPQLLSFSDTLNSWQSFSLGIPDFALWKIDLVHETALPKKDGAKIILCLKGNAILRSQNESLPINRGESVIIPHSQSEVTAIGKALLIMATDGSIS